MSTRFDTRSGAAPLTRRVMSVVLRAAVGLAVPSALYYMLRAFDQSIYLSLVVSTLLSAVPALWALVRGRKVDRLATYLTTMTLGGLAVTLVPGDTRFLLAKESVMIAVTGIWFLLSTRVGGRPLAYVVSRPLLEGRLRWPEDWEQLWTVSVRFRRMWRVSSLLWGLGLLVDAGGRVVLAYTMPPDLVPALGVALYLVTVVVLNVVVNVYYVLSRVHDPRSPLRRGDAGRQPDA